jgi:hypothetical protein
MYVMEINLTRDRLKRGTGTRAERFHSTTLYSVSRTYVQVCAPKTGQTPEGTMLRKLYWILAIL